MATITSGAITILISRMAQQPDSAADMIATVLTIFQEINRTQLPTKTHIFELVRLHRANPPHFQSAFELAYLKIFKIFHERANRKMPPKYEQLATSFFQEILPRQRSDSPSGKLFNFFLQLLAEGVFSSLSGIRIICSRMLFHLIKLGADVVGASTRKEVLKSIYYLIRLKVSTYKQVGIKLASLVLAWPEELRGKIEEELFKILAVEDNEQIRKMTITNLQLRRDILQRVLMRLRDKSTDIRSIVVRKLIGEKYPLTEMDVNHRYHLLYDGYGNRETAVQQETIKYFARYFDTEGHTYQQFINLFRPDLLLMYPHLYTLFDNLLSDLIEEVPISSLSEFTRKFTNELKSISKNGNREPLRQLIWLKNIGKSQNSQLKGVFEECVPSGTELSRLLLDLVQSKDIFSINECLQLFSIQKSCDELGRNKMFDSLKRVVLELQYFQIDQNWQTLQNSDICPPQSAPELVQKKMLLSYFDLPVISNSYDLIYEIGVAMKALWPDHYEIQLKQVMAEWNNPEQNTLIKERELALTNIRKMEGQPDSRRILETLQGKLMTIEEQLEREGIKTRLIILTLNRLRAGSTMDDFMPIIKQDLAKKNQSQGLILLGLYCLQDVDRVQTFLPLYWMHLINQQNSKIHLLVSLKVTIDFMVKFDLSTYQNKHGEIEQFTYEKYLRKLLLLILSNDADTRILAIEGLCRLMYHNRVSDVMMGSCFVRLLLLWWETSSQQVSARSVHTISIFVKQYIERGQDQVRKLSESLCIFFKIMLIEQGKRRMLNKKKITYNLKIDEFTKRAVVIAVTVLKYHKQSRQIIWKYHEAGAELGPQELFLLFLLKHQDMHFCLEKAVNNADFHEEAPLQTLILVKKQIQVFFQKQGEGSYSLSKKLDSMMKKLEQQIEQKISIKNQQTFNEQMLNGLKKELHQYQLLIDSEANRLVAELETDEIFIENQDAEDESNANDSELQEQMEEVMAEIDEVLNVSSEEPQSKSKEEPKPKKQQKKKNGNLARISEGNEEEEKEVKIEEPLKKKTKKQVIPEKIERRGTRKRAASPISISQSDPQSPKNIIPARTRSKHRV